MHEVSRYATSNDTCQPIRKKYSPLWLLTAGRFMMLLQNQNKSEPTPTQKQSRCGRQLCWPKPSARTMRGQVVIGPSQVLNIIMRHCDRRWHGCRCFPLPSVFLRGQRDDELFFCSLAQHDTFSSPDGPHRDSVSRLVCCWAACAGQWNITHTLELSFTWRKPAATNTGHHFFFPPKDSRELVFRPVTSAIQSNGAREFRVGLWD